MKNTTGRFPLELLYDRKLDAFDRLIGICAYSFASWKTGEAKFSLKGLSLRAGIKDQRTVRARLKNLEARGWITIQSQPGKRSLYTLKPLPSDEGSIEEHGIRRNNTNKHTTHSKFIAKSLASASSVCDDKERIHGNSGKRTGEVYEEDTVEVQSVSDSEKGDQYRFVRRVEGDAWKIIGRLHRSRHFSID